VADTKPTNAVNWDTSAFKNAPKTAENSPKPDQTKINQAKPTPPISQAAVAAMKAQAEREDRHRAVLRALIPA
jgi:hypothetical protein